MDKFSVVIDILNDKEKSETNGVMRYGLLCVGEAMQLNYLLIISCGRRQISVAILLRMIETGSRN